MAVAISCGGRRQGEIFYVSDKVPKTSDSWAQLDLVLRSVPAWPLIVHQKDTQPCDTTVVVGIP